MIPFKQFFYPRTVAVIGASTNEEVFGSRYLNALIKYGYKGKLYPVNPHADKIFGLKAYPNVVDIPGSVDLAVISVPARFVAGVLLDCLKKSIKAVVVLTAGFSEIGEEGRVLEKELSQLASQGIRVMGPNCFGVYCPGGAMTLLPGSAFPQESGPVALIAQSGLFSEMIVVQSRGQGIRFSKVISYGNACDINEADLLEYLAEDAETKVILAYIEGVKDGRRFLDIVRRVSRTKPVVIWKAGLTQLGTAAASSHTGSLAGDKAVWDAFFRQSGAIQVGSGEELIDAAIAFTKYPSGCGSRVGLVSGGGGSAVTGADLCENLGLALPTLARDIQDKLGLLLPNVGVCVRNPIDIATPHPSVKLLTSVLETVASSEQIDVIIMRQIFLSVKATRLVIGFSTVSEEEQKQLMEIPLIINERFGKTLVMVLEEEMTDTDMIEFEAERRRLRDYYLENGIPVYSTLDRAMRAVAHLAGYQESGQRA